MNREEREQHKTINHGRIQKVLSGGSSFDAFFFVCFCFLAEKGRDDLNTIKRGPSLARQR